MQIETFEGGARYVSPGGATWIAAPPVPDFTAPARRAGGRLRLLLTRRAPALFRVHLVRSAFRIVVLALADAATLLLVWLTIQGLLLAGWLGTGRVLQGISAGQFILAVGVTLALFGCYGPADERRNAAAIFRAALLGTGLALWERIWSVSALGALPALLMLSAAVALALTLERKLVDWLVRMARPAGGITRAAVVGPRDLAARLVDHPAFGETPWCHLAGSFDPQQHQDDTAASLTRLVSERRIDTLFLVGGLNNEVFGIVLDVAAASGCQVYSLPRVSPTSMVLPKVLWRNGSPVVELTRPGLMGAKLSIKRAIDIVGAGLLVLITAPAMLLIALVLRLRGEGGVLFRQSRIGQGGKSFTILKFRTMVEGAEGQLEQLREQSLYADARLFKLDQDPRVTRIGAFLRRTSLDELPQLWNVLRGDMSLVGPRPPLPSEVELYEEHQYARFDVKPGITGPWQVSGRNSIRDFDKVIHLEMAYIRRWSIWRDLSLLLRTVPAVLSRRGAL